MNFTKYLSDLMEDDQFANEVLGIDRLEQLAQKLAEELTTDKESSKEKSDLLFEIQEASNYLLESYLNLTKDLKHQSPTPASNWFMDNFHIVEDQMRSIKRDLPKGFYKELPKINHGEFKGYPRVYAIAFKYLLSTDSRLDLNSIKRFVKAFQTTTPLTIGELWAIAISIRISLIKRLHPLVQRIIIARQKREEADLFADSILEMASRANSNPDDIEQFLANRIKNGDEINRPFLVQLIQRLREQDPAISKSFDWLENFLHSVQFSTSELVQLEHYRQAAAQVTTGNIISSMRLISEIDWHDFFEEVSLVDPILNQDSANAYIQMDRSTKDSYRKIIEKIARRSEASEIEVASKAIELTTKREGRECHVGYFLLDNGVRQLEKELNYKSPVSEKIVRFVDEDPGFIYFGSLTLLLIFFISALLKVFPFPDSSPYKTIALVILLLLPTSELSLSVLHYIITLLRLPKKLPRMNTDNGILGHDMTMVVVPCMLSSKETILELVSNLEVQFLANQDENIYYSLLGDLSDAQSETTENDQAFLMIAFDGIEKLNHRYASKTQPRFYLFHRTRLYNFSEKKWICWERKRGKIMEFNHLLRGDKKTSFITHHIDFEFLNQIKYVITLDADTQLPLQNARRLVGTITHPLNQPVLCPIQNRVIAGYGILQPRISVSMVSGARTRFSKIFSGLTGIDPYTTAISDVYQDLFNEGSFTGKGLYVVDAFEKVIGERVPENFVLSHDLLEGSFARVGLTTDLELIDDYPSSFDVFSKRLHRWTRGDWQIAWWLLPFVINSRGKIVRNNLPLISRWKIFDNLRRSLLSPVILLWLLLSWTILPGSALLWTFAIMVVMSFPVYAPSLTDIFRKSENEWGAHLRICWSEARKRLKQVFFMFIFMPALAVNQLDAIFRSLYRMFISRKNLLEWVTFSQIQNKKSETSIGLELFSAGPVVSIFYATILLIYEINSFFIALPFLTIWCFSPLASRWTNKRSKKKIAILDVQEVRIYRQYARLTWHFFENFAGADNNWLAPDNFQEEPVPRTARRTSPTNIGLQLMSTLSAYDMGYLGFRKTVENLELTISTMLKLERYEGHFYNWYDTQSLAPLHPRYVSTVDSGNLAGHLVVIKQAALKLSEGPFVNPKAQIGMIDGLNILIEKLDCLQKTTSLPMNQSYIQTKQLVKDISSHLIDQKWENIIRQLMQVMDNIAELSHQDSQSILTWIRALINQAESYEADETQSKEELAKRLVKIAEQCQSFYEVMSFKFLFEDERKIFAIGFNVTESRRDNSYYDLLASEARLASFFAIAKGDVPDEHWFRLGRQLTNLSGGRALVSWSASMFEYLMPLLVMRSYEDTLLDQTYESVILRQIDYGEQRQCPWGVSEAGYHARDLNFNYQYGPFGVPGLGLKRGLKDELVISPYSSMLAAMFFPRQALANLRKMEKMEVLGQYGFHESIDFTVERVLKDKKYIILKSYMAHHQGMSLISINNLLNKFIMQRRFHAEPRVKAVELLLQERIPPLTPIMKPRAEETHIESFARFSENLQTRIYTDPSLSTPRTQIISNGNYSVMMTTTGSGYAKCEGRAIYRWKEDSTMDNWGHFIYIQNITANKTWSAGFQPIESKPKKYEAHFSEDKIEILREDFGVTTNLEVIVSSEDNVEMRRVSLTNMTNQTVEIEVTSYMEVVLARAIDDSAHPTFSNLFIQSEFRAETNSLLAHRRLRKKDDIEVWGLHVLTVEGETVGPIQYETDRSKFLGRGRSVKNPIILSNHIELSNTTGAVLDPIFSLRQRVKIPPRQTARLIYSTGLVYSQVEAIRVSQKYNDPNVYLRQVNLGWIKAQIGLRHLNISLEKAKIYQRLGGRIIYLAPYLRAQTHEIMKNKKNQSTLWAYGISGDYPIILTRIKDEKDMEMIRDLLRGHEYLRLKGLKIDLVIINEHATSYLQNLQDELMRQILISGSHTLMDKPGGIFIRRADLIPHDDLVLIKSVARVRLMASKGLLSDQLRRRPHELELPPRFIPTAQKKDYARIPFTQPELKFFNGFGGFSPDGKEYITILKDEQWTPAPWINVVANKNDFGFIVSESGQGFTWSINSRENRISPWSNDPVSDPVSETIYIRDEETGAFWSPTPLPIRNAETYLVKHGQGYTEFLHSSHGIAHHLTLFVPVEDPVKIIKLRLKNLNSKTRKLSITSYIDWVLGFSRSKSSQTILTSWHEDSQTILATNSYNNEFAHRVAFLSHAQGSQSYTCDRKEFIGRNGSMANPAALRRKNLSRKSGGGLDSCGAIQTMIELGAHEEKDITILLGQDEDEEKAQQLSLKYKDKKYVESSFTEVLKNWDDVLTSLIIETPNKSMDMLVNRWLLYQTLSCRIWARSAFYQSGGAFGYRDQLQDVMAMVYSKPEITRAQIKLAASRQFPEGDVQHWWHPPTGRGVRTRFSDDLLWLPFVASYYVSVTGDSSILEELVPFIEAPQLTEEHDETYTQPRVSSEKASVYEHCLRTIDRSLKVGEHGLPLMGSGDWNDGMSQVGHLGKGESVWMAWFLIKTLKGFIPICEKRNDSKHVEIYRNHIKELKNSIESNAWDGEWYLRAYFDNGEKMGSHLSEECKIDAIAQSWSVLSGEGTRERSELAMAAVDKFLIDRENKIIKLFTPPFDNSSQEPGYIKGYLPGVRENGGQYTHAAIWSMMAYAEKNDGKTAVELFNLINPINRSDSRTGSEKYKVEPYVISADIYSVSPHQGRGGWSWYTGSASWMYRAAIESILGFNLHEKKIILNPKIPKEWDHFNISYRVGKTKYLMTVLNNQTDSYLELDGIRMNDFEILIVDDGKEHLVVLRIFGLRND